MAAITSRQSMMPRIEHEMPHRANDLEDRYDQSALSRSLYQTRHLFDRFQLLFTHGVHQWKDADILLFGERHDWTDVTRWFMSHFAPAEPLLVCVEIIPSMRAIKDQEYIRPHIMFNAKELTCREAKFIGWDAEEHLAPKGNDCLTHRALMLRYHEIVGSAYNISKNLYSIFKYCLANTVVFDEVEVAHPDQLRAFENQQEELDKVINDFIATMRPNPLDNLYVIPELNALLIQMLEINSHLKTYHSSLWQTNMEANEYAAMAATLRSEDLQTTLQPMRTQLEWIQMELDKGVVTDKEIMETFPARTAAMVATIKNVGEWMARGMSGRTMLIAGALHLRTGEDLVESEFLVEPEFCLDSLYEELRNHKVAVVIQTL